MSQLPKIHLNKLGPGLRFVKDKRGNNRDRGVSTAMVPNINSAADLWNAVVNAPFPYKIPGSGLFPATLQEVEGIDLGGTAMLVARYNRPNRVVRPRWSCSPGGIISVPWWFDATGNLLPSRPRSVTITTEEISWHKEGTDYGALVGAWGETEYRNTINGSAYTILNKTYPAYTLRFDGIWLRLYVGGAYISISASWRFAHNPGASFTNGPVGWQEASPDVHGASHLSYRAASWGALP